MPISWCFSKHPLLATRYIAIQFYSSFHTLSDNCYGREAAGEYCEVASTLSILTAVEGSDRKGI